MRPTPMMGVGFTGGGEQMNHIFFLAKQLADETSSYFSTRNNDIGVARQGLKELILCSGDSLACRQYKRMLTYLELYEGNKEIGQESEPLEIPKGIVTPHD